MNEYHALAKIYFQQVEGWHLYRSKGDKLLWLWSAFVLLGLGMVWPLGNAIRATRWVDYGVWLFFIVCIELVVIWIAAKILKGKSTALIQQIDKQHTVLLTTEQECREFLLSKVLDRSSDKFSAVAKEISDLLKLRQEFRGRDEAEPEQFWRAVYDRDSKPRLIAVTLGAITLLTALTIRSVPEGPLLFEVLNDQKSLDFIKKLVLVSAGLFALLVFARAVFGTIWHVTTIWWTKSVSAKESRTALRYLARDLVLLHKPVKSESADRG